MSAGQVYPLDRKEAKTKSANLLTNLAKLINEFLVHYFFLK